MRRLALSAILPLLAVLLFAVPAGAGLTWCKSDPIVRLNGTEVQIWVAIPEEYQAYVNGPIDVEVATPKAVTREVVFTDEGFNGHGEEVRFTDLKGPVMHKTFPVVIRVKVPIDRASLGSNVTIPVQVEIVPDNAAAIIVSGTTNLTEAKLLVTGRY